MGNARKKHHGPEMGRSYGHLESALCEREKGKYMIPSIARLSFGRYSIIIVAVEMSWSFNTDGARLSGKAAVSDERS
jgi:hypothetical protein